MAAAEIAVVQERALTSHRGRAVVVSCQRLEAFGDSPCDCDAPDKWTGRAAVLRIAEVAAGLHSAVLGEDQIMGQVRAGFADAPPSVRRLADLAIAAARELRRGTAFDSHAGHLLDRGLRVARLPAGGTLLVLGTGAMGRLVAARGLELGFDEVIVAGRSEPTGGRSDAWEFVPLDRIRGLAPIAVVAGCLGSGAGELSASQLPAAQLALDFGTPRNFVTNTSVITIADLLRDERSRPHALRRRAELQGQLGAILERRLRSVGDTGASLVGSLRLEVDRVRQRELAKMQRLHPQLAPELLETLTRSLVDQIFHRPSARLRELDDPSLGRELVALFSDD